MEKLFNFGKDRELLFQQLSILIKILYPIAIIALVLSGIAFILLIVTMFFPFAYLYVGVGRFIFSLIVLIFGVFCILLLLKWISVSRPRIEQKKNVTYQVPFLILVSSVLSIISYLLDFSGASVLGLIINLCFGYLYFMTFRAAYLLNTGKAIEEVVKEKF